MTCFLLILPPWSLGTSRRWGSVQWLTGSVILIVRGVLSHPGWTFVSYVHWANAVLLIVMVVSSNHNSNRSKIV